ncbi:GGDEF domain-containing protein [uncultured Desulfosarcina sp.]|uniref:GGDEF domain-containing protein n=1 Tax=uncultured Desulfosarcina sp. TaxID=218289 RepID=UPI0029C993D6|nr:GGDEF domain-containing protein [uncultured Desulfosarcina sp.]
MFDKLMPKDDVKQRIRMKRALQALGGAASQSLVSVILFFSGGFRLDLQGFILLMIFLWVGHLTIPILIRLDINRRFSDPSMTREMVNWAIFTLLVTVFFMDHYRSLMLMYFPIILLYGAFSMTPNQYRATAAVMILGYVTVIFTLCQLHPNQFKIEEEFVAALVFALVIVAFSFVSNEISLLRKKLYRRNTELAKAIEKIEHMAITDELTGLTNRRHMMHMLRRQKAVADRGGNGFCVCFFDLDRFKSINDRMGHHVGDVVLKRFSSEVRSQLRDSDMFARFGGEEFVLLANGVDLERATIAADRIRKAIEALRFKDVAPDLTVTVSGGVAQFQSKEKIEALLSRADQALYSAKGKGGNCIKAEPTFDVDGLSFPN